jgi:hypothetical protein
MTKNIARFLAVVFPTTMLWIGCGQAPESEQAVEATPQTGCTASADWITNPDPPSEIGGGVPVGEETNCQFYQFAWQWFLDLSQPVDGSDERRFETLRVYQPGQTDQCSIDGVTGKAQATAALFARTAKSDTDLTPTIPAELDQATGQPLYAQPAGGETEGDIVLYNLFYSPNECQATTTAGFEPSTIEIKASWKQLAAADPSYYTIEANVDGFSDPLLLGMVGFHLVINTADHPEFVWATFEHKSNAPTCDNPAATPVGGWSFTSDEAAECLAQNGPGGCSMYNFNSGTAVQSPPLAAPATEVCQVYPLGTDPGSMTGGNNNDTNRANITSLNDQLVGPNGFLTELAPNDPMAVWSNYALIGGLWTNGGVGSQGTDVQRGSLELANTTMETFAQSPDTNCFSCHAYDPATPLDVSHIAGSLLPSSGQGED